MGDTPAERAPDRGETPLQKQDRNRTDLLQELRVLQTGIQILTGFLLTLPFQQRFTALDPAQVGMVGLILVGTIGLVFDLVLSGAAGAVAAVSVAVLVALLWLLLPLLLRRRALRRRAWQSRHRRPRDGQPKDR